MPLIYVRYLAPSGAIVERPYTCGLEDALFQLARRRCSYITWWFAE